MDPIRKQYEKLGVEQFYTQHAADYANPHLPQITDLLQRNEARIDFRQILDLSSGHGEVSAVVRQLGYTDFVGSDPFTWRQYTEKTRAVCHKWSFEDIIRGQLKGQYSSVICSFAMHLCPPKQLYPLVSRIFQHTDQLVIITPHKRPQLEKLDGVRLLFEDFSLTLKGKKVRLKSYVRDS
ncbi:MAG: hypothetical protein AAFO94_03540 [Bacteroidota bacterium]